MVKKKSAEHAEQDQSEQKERNQKAVMSHRQKEEILELRGAFWRWEGYYKMRMKT